jgi:hypothetical protein
MKGRLFVAVTGLLSTAAALTIAGSAGAAVPAASTATVLWPAGAGNGFEGLTVGSQAGPKRNPSGPRTMGALAPVYKNIQHDWDSAALCTLTVSSDRARTGSKSLKITLGAPASDRGGSNDPGRCQATPNYPDARNGSDLWYGWSQYLDSGWSANEMVDSRKYFLGLAGFRLTDTLRSGPGANLDVDRSQYYTGINLSGATSDFPIGHADFGGMRFGGWDDFVVHVRWSTSSNGVMEWWRNGVKLSSYTGRTLGAGRKVARRQGIYEGVGVSQTRVMYVDNDRIGTSYAAVDPSR